MPIDPRIPLMGQPAQGPSPMEVFGQIAQLQAMRQQAEERAEVSAEKRAIRARQKQIETAMQGAITLDPEGQPTVDFAKLVPHLPAPMLLEVKKVVDEGKKLALELRTTSLTHEEKQIGYRGLIARGIAAGNYDQTLFETGIVSARRAGALTQTEADQILSQSADPDFRKRTVDSAIAQAVALAGGKAPELERVTTVENGQEVTKFVAPTAGTSYPTAPKAPAALSYQAKDVLLDGKPAMASFNPQTGTYTVNGQDVTARVRPIPPQGPGPERLVSVVGPDGKPVYVRESAALGQTPGTAAEGGAKPPTGPEQKALGFWVQAGDASDTLTRPDSQGNSLEDRVAKGLVGQIGLKLHTSLQSPEQRAYTQARRNFTEARLRQKSGSAIGAHEYTNDEVTYFAQPGDDAATIAQKRAARQKVLEGMALEAGAAYEQYTGKPLPTAAKPASATASHKVGDIVTVKGQKVRVTKLLPNDQYEGVPVP